MRTQVSCLYRFLPQPSIPLRSHQLPARPLRTPGDIVQVCGAGQSLHSWQLAKQSTASRGPRDTKGKPHELTLPYNMPNTYNQSLERVTGRSPVLIPGTNSCTLRDYSDFGFPETLLFTIRASHGNSGKCFQCNPDDLSSS